MNLVLSADDRTGALEIGGLIAHPDHPIPVGPAAEQADCRVIDIASRHLSAQGAKDRMQQLLNLPATHRAQRRGSAARARPFPDGG